MAFKTTLFQDGPHLSLELGNRILRDDPNRQGQSQ
jgi:hypothetical protein